MMIWIMNDNFYALLSGLSLYFEFSWQIFNSEVNIYSVLTFLQIFQGCIFFQTCLVPSYIFFPKLSNPTLPNQPYPTLPNPDMTLHPHKFIKTPDIKCDQDIKQTFWFRHFDLNIYLLFKFQLDINDTYIMRSNPNVSSICSKLDLQ